MNCVDVHVVAVETENQSRSAGAQMVKKYQNKSLGENGGARPGAGRKPGSPNRKKQLEIDKAAANGLLPHEFLCAVSQGQVFDGHKPTFAERIEAAKEAAPYFAGKRATIAHAGPEGTGPVRIDFSGLSDDQLRSMLPLSPSNESDRFN